MATTSSDILVQASTDGRANMHAFYKTPIACMLHPICTLHMTTSKNIMKCCLCGHLIALPKAFCRYAHHSKSYGCKITALLVHWRASTQAVVMVNDSKGEVLSYPKVITSLPFVDNGSTTSLSNDYVLSCNSGSSPTAGKVVDVES